MTRFLPAQPASGREPSVQHRCNTPLSAAAQTFPLSRGARAQAYRVYVKPAQRRIGGKDQLPAARDFLSEQDARTKAYRVYVESEAMLHR